MLISLFFLLAASGWTAHAVAADVPVTAVVTVKAVTTFTQGITQPLDSLNPFSVAGIDAFTVTGNILEALARSNPYTGEIEPVLAESWSLDPKNKTFRVKLRRGVVFHNGDPLTATDVKFTFDAYFDPKFKAQIWQGMWSEIESVHVIDPLTVDFKMKNWRYQTFETTLTSLRILPRSFYGDVALEKFRKNIVGTGPFKMKSFARYLELEPNPNWLGPLKPQHNLSIKVIASAALAGEMRKRGELDFYALEAGQSPDPNSATRLKTGLGSGLWIDLNLGNSLFRDSEVRRALQLLWRRKEMNQKIFGGQMQIMSDLFSPATDLRPRARPDDRATADDPAAARTIFKNQKWSDSNKDGTLDKDGKKFEFTVLVKSNEQERWMSFFQADAKACGVRVHIVKVEDDDQWLKRLREGRFDAAAGGGGLINEPTSLVWHSGAPYNFQKFSDKRVDALTEALESEFNLERRRLILRQIIARIAELRPFVPGLFTEEESFLLSPRLKVDPKIPARAERWTLR